MNAKKAVKKSKTTKQQHLSAKTSAKKPSTRQTAHITKQYHPAFGAVLIAACALIVAILLPLTIKTFIESIESDAMRFSSEYTNVGIDNVYKYKTAEEVIDTLKHGTGIVYLGFPSCPWCQSYTKMLNDLAKEKGIKEIYYYNIYDDREHGTAAYDELIGILGDYLQTNASGDKRIYVPNITFVVDGEIIGNDYETSKDTLGLQKPDDYWTKERVSAWREKISPLLDIFAKK